MSETCQTNDMALTKCTWPHNCLPDAQASMYTGSRADAHSKHALVNCWHFAQARLLRHLLALTDVDCGLDWSYDRSTSQPAATVSLVCHMASCCTGTIPLHKNDKRSKAAWPLHAAGLVTRPLLYTVDVVIQIIATATLLQSRMATHSCWTAPLASSLGAGGLPSGTSALCNIMQCFQDV